MTANTLRIDAAQRANSDSEVRATAGGGSGQDAPHSLRHNLTCSTADAAGYSFMVGIGESYIAPFALAIGLGEIAAGLVVTVPILLGALFQMAAPTAVLKLRSCKRLVVWSVSLQGVALLALPVIALIGGRAGWFVFLAATIYWAAGLAAGPAWNVWMEQTVPTRLRARYFANRVRVSQAMMLIGLAMGGVLLQVGNAYGHPEIAFVLLFSLAATARFVSALYLNRQGEMPDTGSDQQPLRLANIGPWTKGQAGAALILYLLCMQTAVYISGPYFTPYMRSLLGLSYLEFMTLTAMGYVGKILALPLFGRYAQKYGARRLLWIGGLGIAPLAGMWLATGWLPSRAWMPYLIVVQISGGVTWAAYELAMFLLFFESIPRERRAAMLTVYNLGNSLAMVCGGLVGAGVLGICGETQGWFLTLFVGSSIARLATIPLLSRVSASIKRSRASASPPVADLPTATLVTETPPVPTVPPPPNGAVRPLAALREVQRPSVAADGRRARELCASVES